MRVILPFGESTAGILSTGVFLFLYLFTSLLILSFISIFLVYEYGALLLITGLSTDRSTSLQLSARLWRSSAWYYSV